MSSASSEFWGLEIADLETDLYDLRSDAIGSHYIAFAGDKQTARQKMIDLFTALIDRRMYRATPYGSQDADHG